MIRHLRAPAAQRHIEQGDGLLARAHADAHGVCCLVLNTVMLVVVGVNLHLGRIREIQQLPGNLDFHETIAVAEVGQGVVFTVAGVGVAVGELPRLVGLVTEVLIGCGTPVRRRILSASDSRLQLAVITQRLQKQLDGNELGRVLGGHFHIGILACNGIQRSGP